MANDYLSRLINNDKAGDTQYLPFVSQFGGVHVQYRSDESSYRRSSGSTYRLAIDLMAVVSGLFGAGCR